MDEKSLELLEFHRIRKILAGFTSFSVSRAMAARIQPLSDYEQVSALLRQSAEARHLLSLEPEFSIGEVRDIREAVKLAARGKILEAQSLARIQQTLAATRQLHSNIEELSEKLPLLWNIAADIVEMPRVEKDIANCVTAAGELLDSASPALANLKQRLKQAHQQLLNQMESMTRAPEWQKILQEPIVTQREGRYVIPIKLECRKEMKGIVHDISNTGATVFVEPLAAVELGNEIRELAMEEQREIERILRALSAEVGACESEICHNIVLAADLDLALAKAKYARSAGATEAILTRLGENENRAETKQPNVLKLVEARHPLLGTKAVALSLDIGQDFSIMVITGPNTGGKTVALKTVGLLSLMTQAGMPIPASAESCIPIFDGIFADIGDEQSIEQTLSTFSWHMGNIVRIIKNVTEGSLVLLDELAASTDPVEGSALARSILLYFLSKRTITLATTHYSELKAFAYTTQGLRNASLEFDPVTLTPTYHLTLGIPGGSNALATASRLGLPDEITTSARDMLPRDEHDMETLLGALMSEKQKAEILRHNLEIERDEVERRNRELADELRRLRTEERKVIQETRDRVTREAADLQKEIRQVTSELRKERSKERIEQARKALDIVGKQLESPAWQAIANEQSEEESIDLGNIVAGDTVRLKEANLQATVLSASEKTQQIEVQVGQTRIWLGLDRVEKIAIPSVSMTSPISSVRKELGKRIVPVELDLRGKWAEEVEPALDGYLNDASLANLNEARIIHGFGTGTVRQIVRDFVASHPLVKSFRPGERGEGGDGVTIVKL